MTNYEIWFTARKKFDPSKGQAWADYIRWAGLPHLAELLTLDTSLCPDVIETLTAEDWQHNVQEDYHLFYFRNLDYLLSRVRDSLASINILAAALEPPFAATSLFNDKKFIFQGYDLVDIHGDISALTNCSGFEQAFSKTDLSEVGLLKDYAFAKEVQESLRRYYPEEHHANCNLWAIWRLKNQG